MKIYFLNVGYGDCILIKNENACIVVDGGSNRPSTYENKATVRLIDFLKYLNVKIIDLMVISHIHEDHISGLLEVMTQVTVKQIWTNMLPQCATSDVLLKYKDDVSSTLSGRLFHKALFDYCTVLEIATTNNIKISSAYMGSQSKTIGGITVMPIGMNTSELEIATKKYDDMFTAKTKVDFLKSFYENDCHCNKTSLCLYISNENYSILLSGDKTDNWESIFEQNNIKADVIKVAHHGQKDGMSETIIKNTKPKIIVICADNLHTFSSAEKTIIKRANNALRENASPYKAYVTGELSDGGCALSIFMDEKTNQLTTEIIYPKSLK